MKRERLMAVCLAGGLSLIPVARAVVSGDNPYKTIVERNPFGLIPPPPPAPPETNTPPSNIKLTGITTILGMKNALLMAQEPGPGKLPQYLMLTEGQREGQVEVLAIDNIAGTVKLNNAGVVSTLTFEKDGLKAPTGPAPAPAGAPGGIPAPGAIPRIPTPGSPGSTTTIGGGSPGAAPASSGGGLRQIPTRSLRMPQSSAQLNAPPPAASPEVQILSQAVEMEANKQKAVQEGNPAAAIYPDTSHIFGDGPPMPGPPMPGQ